MRRFHVQLGITVLAVAGFSSCFANAQKTVYGLERAQDFNSRTKGSFYIQAATFSIKKNASNYQHQMQPLTSYPVRVSHKGSFYIVTVGPMHSAHELRKTADALLHSSRTKTLVRTNERKNTRREATYTSSTIRMEQADMPVQSHKTTSASSSLQSFFTSLSSSKGNWFFSVGSGAEFPMINTSLRVDNESLFDPPLDKDIYTTSQSQAASALVNASAGRRWMRDSQWLPAFSLGIFYQHSFSTDLGGKVIQYSLPRYTNYNYTWSLSSDIILASAKVNLYAKKSFLPYVTLGLGGAMNHTSYSESALSDVTPRISPNFSETNGQFALNVGGGLDYQLADYLIVNVGYLYQYLGNVTAQGKGTWSNTSLGLNSYGLNEVVAGLTYLYDK